MNENILVGRPIKYPIEDKNVGQFFFNSAEKYCDKICQIDATIDKTETFKSVKLRSTRVALALQKKGLTSSDVVALCSSNTLDNTIPMLASFYLGAKVTNLEASLSVRHTKHLLTLVTPKIIFVEESALSLIEDSLKATKIQSEIIVFGQSSVYSTFSDLVQPQPNEQDFQPSDVDMHDVIIMFFSSGTTGLPKAICHSHYTFLHIINQSVQIGVRDLLFHYTNFYWLTAIIMLSCSFKVGSTRVFTRSKSAGDFFKLVEKYKVQSVFLAPVLTYNLTSYERAQDHDTSSVNFVMLAGTPMPSSQYQKMSDLFKNAILIQVYGMSEAGVVAAFESDVDKDIAKKKSDTCGRPGPGICLKVVEPDNGKALGPNQRGEICIKSPTLMKGYYKTDSSDVFDGDGFLKTGDIGYYDDDGCVHLEGRSKEMFKYQSWHIVPNSIEAVLLEHPAVEEAVVFGVPHDVDGEIPAACIVLKQEFAASSEEIDTFLEERVADREKLRGGISFLKELPRTPTGKIIRKEVRDMVIETMPNRKELNLS